MKKLLITSSLLLVAATAFAATFNHGEHIQHAENDCATCHISGVTTVAPSKDACLSCHGEDEVADAKIPKVGNNIYNDAKNDGMQMPLKDQAMQNVHRGDFMISHPIDAKTNPQLCASCHSEQKFCNDCHDDFNRDELASPSHRRSWSDLALSPSGVKHEQFAEYQCQTCHPDSVLPTHKWTRSHARDARKNLATCATCHPQGDVCLKCHSANSGLQVNPHPSDWNDFKDNLRDANNGKTCRKCH